jgi:asparagine synthase (glutamine-hydrolysing)
VQTFTIGFDEKHFSEAQSARQVADRFQTDHHEFIFRSQDLKKTVEGVIAAADEPLADPAALPLYELSRQAHTHVTVALCGDGGDETLAGYQRYLLDRLMRSYTRLPGWITTQAVPWLAERLPEPAWQPEDRSPLTGMRRLGQFAAISPKASILRWGSYLLHSEKMALYSDALKSCLSELFTETWIAEAYDRTLACSPLDRTLSADHITYLAGDLLPKTDRVTMAHSLEARAPLLDLEWVEWTARLPDRFKVRGLQTKWLLRHAFEDLLPSGIGSRGKQGFSVPVGHWLRNELSEWVDAVCLKNSALGEYFNLQELQNMIRSHKSGRRNIGKKLWAAAIFSLWLKGSSV